ncbi:tetratricopeptide repeat protein [Pedobacter sp. P351]|uniref:tetratricopeptide repeat protein n=1 Tax=Pedobacter superstes TaxID=3133441 RepID=UPI0030ABF898
MKSLLFTLFFVSAFFFSHAQVASEDVLALQYYQSGEFEKALSIYQKLFSQSKNQAQYYDAYFNTLIKLKHYDDAEKLVKKMSSANKGNFSYQIDLGRLFREQGQQEKAADIYNNLIKNLPKDEAAIRDLSISFYRADAYDFSIKTLLSGRKILNDEEAFAFDLLALYRYQKNKGMLVQEYINLFSKETNVQLVNQAKSAFSSLFESSEDYDILKTALLRKIQKDPQNIAFSEMLAWQYIQQKEFDMALKQIVALDKRLKEEGDRVYDLVSIFLANKAYEQAIEGLEYLLTKGPSSSHYVPAKMQILYTKNQQLISGKFSNAELLQLEKDYLSLLQEFGRTRNTVFAMRQLALLQASYLNKAKLAETLLEETLKIPGLTATLTGQTKLELGDVYILTGEVWEAALIYGQVEKEFANEPIGQEAKYKSAKLSYYQGDFTWSRAQLDVLKSSTSQLIANDALNLSLLIAENTESEADTNALRKYAKADFLIFINQYDKALKTLDSINILYPKNSLEDDILMSKARIFQKQNLLDKSIEQLNLIVAKHGTDLWADDALFMLAEIYELSLNNNAKASEYYQKIIIDFPGSLYVTEARKRFRVLRGDNLG